MANDREREAAIREVLAFLHANDLTMDDLIEYGGEDLESLNQERRDTAKLVERAWAIMARHSLSIEDLEEEG